MTRSILLVALLSSACHTTVYRTESEPVRIHATRPRTNGASVAPTGSRHGQPVAPAPEDAEAPDAGARP